MKRLSMSAAASAALVFSASALATENAEIYSPMPDEKIFSDTLGLVASDPSAAGNDINWAVRISDNNPNCSKGPDNIYNVFGNVEGMTDGDGGWSAETGNFGATFNITHLDAGAYCFAFNTTVGEADGVRLVQDFYIVNTYGKVSGGFRFGESITVRGNSPTHAFEGFIADAGGSGLIGSFFVNYRELGVTCTFSPGDDTSIEILGTEGEGSDHPAGVRTIFNNLKGGCSDGSLTDSARFFILERGAILGNRADGDSGGLTQAPRGAVVVRWDGGPTVNDLEIDATPGEGGVDSWIILERGNGVVGIRSQ